MNAFGLEAERTQSTPAFVNEQYIMSIRQNYNRFASGSFGAERADCRKMMKMIGFARVLWGMWYKKDMKQVKKGKYIGRMDTILFDQIYFQKEIVCFETVVWRVGFESTRWFETNPAL